MRIKMWLYYPLLQSLDSYKVCLYFIVLLVTVCTVGYICFFHGDQTFVDFVSLLSMIIYEVLYTWCLRYNICSAWFLDIKYQLVYHSCLSHGWLHVSLASVGGAHSSSLQLTSNEHSVITHLATMCVYWV